jgi:transposase
MDDFDQANQDATTAPLDEERLLKELARALNELQLAKQRIAALEKEIAALKQQGGSGTVAGAAKVAEPFSMRAEEKRQQKRGQKKRKQSKKQRRGRIANEEKIRQADQTEDIYPLDVPQHQCVLSHVRVVWRLLDGQGTRVAYRIFRGPKKQYGIIPGVLGRSEFGVEFTLTLAHLVYHVGVSFDKACALVLFFQNVNIRKSQADALLRQLARQWSGEFEVLCTLLANSLVVHADETRWSINSVWAFLSERARLLFFGVHKDAATLKEILDPETFAGLVFSDDAAVYANFGAAQKCWAHLLRKAIKLTLQDPHQTAYRQFADDLLDIFREANRLRRDRRLSEAGRARKVHDLTTDLLVVCAPAAWATPEAGTFDYDLHLLAEEILRLVRNRQLFTFVTAQPAQQPNGVTPTLGGTNNEAERTLRGPALARATGQTSKTLTGARRTSIITSVLQSLRLYLPVYTLRSVIEEIKQWQEKGKSCFRSLMEKLKLALPNHSVLDRVIPLPSG